MDIGLGKREKGFAGDDDVGFEEMDGVATFYAILPRRRRRR